MQLRLDLTPIDKRAKALGVYMRTIAKRLRSDRPMTLDAAQPLTAPWFDKTTNYAAATLHRLETRDIATKVEDGWIRGPLWGHAARYYGWEIDD